MEVELIKTDTNQRRNAYTGCLLPRENQDDNKEIEKERRELESDDYSSPM